VKHGDDETAVVKHLQIELCGNSASSWYSAGFGCLLEERPVAAPGFADWAALGSPLVRSEPSITGFCDSVL